MIETRRNNEYIVITDDDLDGVVCALLIKLAFQESNITVYFSAEKSDAVVNALLDNGEIRSCDKVYITDVVISKETASRINSMQLQNKVVFKDHHEDSAFLTSNDFKWATVDVSKSEDDIYTDCATSLLFEEIKNEIKMKHTRVVYEGIKKVVNDTKEYDTWAWFNKTKNHHALFLNILLFYKGRDRFIHEFLSCIELNKSPIDVYSKNAGPVNGIITTINLMANKYIKEASNPKNQTTILGHTACVFYCDSFLSEIGNYICRDCPDVDIAILWNNKKIGIRTNIPGLNLAKFAISYGGSGRGMSAHIPIKDSFIESINSIITKTFEVDNVPSQAINNEPINNIDPSIPASTDVLVNENSSDDSISSAIDKVLQHGTDISGVKTIGKSPELDWEYEKELSQQRQQEESVLEYEQFLEQKALEEAVNSLPDLEETIVEEVIQNQEEQVKQFVNRQRQNNKKKKKNFKPVK